MRASTVSGSTVIIKITVDDADPYTVDDVDPLTAVAVAVVVGSSRGFLVDSCPCSLPLASAERLGAGVRGGVFAGFPG